MSGLAVLWGTSRARNACYSRHPCFWNSPEYHREERWPAVAGLKSPGGTVSALPAEYGKMGGWLEPRAQALALADLNHSG